MPSILWRVCWIAWLTALVVVGIDWGLPSPSVNPKLFASRANWDGATLAKFDAERVDDGKGADVDRDPLVHAGAPVVLNETDAKRAAIVRRYRLFSHQPDEMITFMALQQMNPAAGQLDPRLYQYGGAWIYPVGGLLKAASLAGLVDLRADKAFYYDHPEAFGRFYVVARAYTVAAYVLTLTLAAMIAWRLTGKEAAAAGAAAVVGLLPVVFALAHEAKPHLMGTAMILATALAGARWTRTGRVRDALLCGAFAGLAAGVVLSGVVAIVIPVAMVFLAQATPFSLSGNAPKSRFAALIFALLAAVVVYAATNPYVVIHAIHGDSVLQSNLVNSKAMYSVGAPLAILKDGGLRLLDALCLPAAAMAVSGVILAVTRRQRTQPLAILLAIPTILTLLQFFAFAAGKPAEYARFALLPATVLGILGVWGLASISRSWLRTAALVAAPLVIFVVGTWPYLRAFAADVTDNNTRTQASNALRKIDDGTLQLSAEPAPYSVPAVDLWKWRWVLSPVGSPPIGDAVLRAIDDPATLGPVPLGYRRQIVAGDRLSPITWANKPFEVLTRE